MRLLLLSYSLLILFLCSCTKESGVLVFESKVLASTILNQDVKYSVCLPENYYQSKEEYPVVYLLHGLGDDETSWIEYGNISQIAKKLEKDNEILPMVYIMPQGFRNYYVNNHDGSFDYQEMFIKELIPHIETEFRVKKDGKSRATLGYSMGGFGAFILPLKHPEIFSVCVPQSISVRTDAQYEVEDSSEWNYQWGRIFGGEGTTGKDRITEFYKQNSPFHLLAAAESDTYKDLRIYIDNGDDENTLAFSNEELHMLMRDRNIKHEFRVRNGGHEFSYWKESLQNGLRFISDAFEGKSYRGDYPSEVMEHLKYYHPLKKIDVSGISFEMLLPQEYVFSTRLFPVVFVLSNLSIQKKEQAAGLIYKLMAEGTIPPVITVFVKDNDSILNDIIIPLNEGYYRARKGFRFRSLIGIGPNAGYAVNAALKPGNFTSCCLLDASDDFTKTKIKFLEIGPKALERTWFYIDAPDNGTSYSYNGNMHMLFRENDFYHEYRVREGNGDFNWIMDGLEESLKFSLKKIHR